MRYIDQGRYTCKLRTGQSDCDEPMWRWPQERKSTGSKVRAGSCQHEASGGLWRKEPRLGNVSPITCVTFQRTPSLTGNNELQEFTRTGLRPRPDINISFHLAWSTSGPTSQSGIDRNLSISLSVEILRSFGPVLVLTRGLEFVLTPTLFHQLTIHQQRAVMVQASVAQHYPTCTLGF